MLRECTLCNITSQDKVCGRRDVSTFPLFFFSSQQLVQFYQRWLCEHSFCCLFVYLFIICFGQHNEGCDLSNTVQLSMKNIQTVRFKHTLDDTFELVAFLLLLINRNQTRRSFFLEYIGRTELPSIQRHKISTWLSCIER